jgi:hypothetical protein
MKPLSRFFKLVLISLLITGISIPPALAGAERSEWPFITEDYNDCTDELVIWDALVTETFLYNETPSGQVLIRDHWRFKGTVEGVTTGFLWKTKGIVSLTERFGLNNSQTGGFALIENALMRPQTPDAPTIRLDVNIRFAFNAHGELVVDRANYTYTCLD